VAFDEANGNTLSHLRIEFKYSCEASRIDACKDNRELASGDSVQLSPFASHQSRCV